MKPKIFNLLERCVEDGVKRGYGKAFKHVENPTEGAICEHIEDCVMSQIVEWFDFEEFTQ